MTGRAERWQRAEQIVHAALESAGLDRLAFLRAACGDDEELRREVEELLAQQSAAGSFLETPMAALAAAVITPAVNSLTGQSFGGLQVGPLLGAGGMGEVYKARDSRLGRDVAIKVLPAAIAADPERLRRFEQEARAVAALSHPNILIVH